MRLFNNKILIERIFETLIAQHVYRFAFRNKLELYYWYDNDEVDLILAKDERIQPIQISYEITDEKTWQREIAGIEKLKKKTNNVTNPLLVVYRGEEKEINGINIVPAKKFLLHIEDYLSS
ncbi:hypothetical protein B6F84_03815 [Acidianus manzaensis]|uniref:DUF4143 domain-containing protein n=1 Tax=Acidianus manzaensis TaxID=282676 RepID=A0A1W6K3E4_9CREN|nr:hypothetical protein B6F84_03815 [Acidianus manzaensis]